MEPNTKRPFNIRAFVALTAAFAVLGLPISGYVNHLLQIYPMTIQRHAWMSAHNILAVIFAAFAIWHVILNRRALFNHTKAVVMRFPYMSREAIFAIGVVAVGLFIAVGHTFLVP